MNKLLTIPLLSLLLACGGSADTKPEATPVLEPPITHRFNLNAPETVLELPKKLREISGITAINDSIIACVQDEKGNIYLFNLNTAKIERKIDFGKDGDYEAISYIANNELMVAKSNGNLYNVNIAQHNEKAAKTKTALSDKNNVEGPFKPKQAYYSKFKLSDKKSCIYY